MVHFNIVTGNLIVVIAHLSISQAAIKAFANKLGLGIFNGNNITIQKGQPSN